MFPNPIPSFSFENMKISRVDVKLIEKQLGRNPRSVLKVLKRCGEGYPQVILSSPVLEDGTPFPTIFWLTCPFLIKEVSRLEGKGLIKHLQSRIKEDGSFRLELNEAHDDYRGKRAELPGFRKDKCNDTGIAGISNLNNLKCLHAHFAHYLATGLNPVGKLVGSYIEEVDGCDECGR